MSELYAVETRFPGEFHVHGTIVQDQFETVAQWFADRGRTLEKTNRTNPLHPDRLVYVCLVGRASAQEVFELRLAWDVMVICRSSPSTF